MCWSWNPHVKIVMVSMMIRELEMDPTWREMPGMVVGIIKGFIESDYDPLDEETDFQAYRNERIMEIRRKLLGKEREDFDYWLELAEQGFPLTEIHDYSLANIPLCNVRYDAIETGRQLVKNQVLENSEDTLYLNRDELSGILRGTVELAGLKELVAEKKAEHTHNFMLVPPRKRLGNVL